MIQKAIRKIKAAYPDFYIITDVCMCEYTDHGHCGALCGHKVDNDATLELLCKTALSHAQAGANMVAPSDMMDGRVGAIRRTLDAAGFQDVPIPPNMLPLFTDPSAPPPVPLPPLVTARATRWTLTTARRL